MDQELEEKYSGVGSTVRFGILARPQLDGVPVQCVITPFNSESGKEYSKFAILSMLAGDDDCDDGDIGDCDGGDIGDVGDGGEEKELPQKK